MKFPDRRMIGRAEREMRACARLPLVQIKPQRRLALRSETGAVGVARAQHKTERRQGCAIKTHAGVEIADFDSDMVVHGHLPSRRVRRANWRRPDQFSASRSWKILRIPREAWRNFSGETPAARPKVRTKLERSPNPTS